MKVPVLAIAAFVGVAALFGLKGTYADQVEAEDKAYESLAETVSEIDDFHIQVKDVDEIEVLEYVSPIDFDGLRAQNEDVEGWIRIVDTKVDYPILFDGTDDYLKKDFNGDRAIAGAIYADRYSNQEDPLNSTNNIIYGHNMKAGTMFAAIDDYTDPDYFASHQDMTIYLPEEEIALRPMACVVGWADGSYRDIETKEDLEAFASDKIVAAGEIEDFKKVWILVTCNYWANDNRTYLFCVAK